MNNKIWKINEIYETYCCHQSSAAVLNGAFCNDCQLCIVIRMHKKAGLEDVQVSSRTVEWKKQHIFLLVCVCGKKANFKGMLWVQKKKKTDMFLCLLKNKQKLGPGWHMNVKHRWLEILKLYFSDLRKIREVNIKIVLKYNLVKL